MQVLCSEPSLPALTAREDVASFFVGQTPSECGPSPFAVHHMGDVIFGGDVTKGNRDSMHVDPSWGLSCLCYALRKKPLPTLDLNCGFLKINKMLCWCRNHAQQWLQSTKIMTVLKKETIMSTGWYEHLHFLFFVFLPPRDQVFHFSLPWLRCEITHGLPQTAAKYTGFRLGTHFWEERLGSKRKKKCSSVANSRSYLWTGIELLTSNEVMKTKKSSFQIPKGLLRSRLRPVWQQPVPEAGHSP